MNDQQKDDLNSIHSMLEQLQLGVFRFALDGKVKADPILTMQQKARFIINKLEDLKGA